MRRTLALCCGLVYLAFGLAAGQVHVHLSPGHHQAARGLHVDHGHEVDEGDHHHHHHSHDPGGSGEARLGDRDLHHHHGGDAVYLGKTSARSAERSGGLLPAIVCFGVTTEPPSEPAHGGRGVGGEPRDPPRTFPPRLRAPPA